MTRWLILQKARRHTAWVLRLLAGARFQVLFHSPLGVLFTFPSRYWSTIGHTGVFSLGGWSPQIHTGFHVSGITQATRARGARGFRLRGSHPVPPALPCRFGYPGPSAPRGASPADARPYNTSCSNASQLTRAWVWAGALSLAATRAISVDFSSSGYLDVSVPRVAFTHPMCSGADTRALPRVGCPIRRSAANDGCLLLTAAYRSWPRPSSSLCAKASTVRPWYLRAMPSAWTEEPEEAS